VRVLSMPLQDPWAEGMDIGMSAHSRSREDTLDVPSDVLTVTGLAGHYVVAVVRAGDLLGCGCVRLREPWSLPPGRVRACIHCLGRRQDSLSFQLRGLKPILV